MHQMNTYTDKQISVFLHQCYSTDGQRQPDVYKRQVLLKEKHACGSFLAYYYNLQGEIIRSDFDYSIQIPIEYLASCKKVIGICSSNVMPKSLLGAMNTGLFTHIIASQDLLESVLDLKRI